MIEVAGGILLAYVIIACFPLIWVAFRFTLAFGLVVAAGLAIVALLT